MWGGALRTQRSLAVRMWPTELGTQVPARDGNDGPSAGMIGATVRGVVRLHGCVGGVCCLLSPGTPSGANEVWHDAVGVGRCGGRTYMVAKVAAAVD